MEEGEGIGKGCVLFTVDLSLSAVHCCMRSPILTNTVSAIGLAAVYSPFTGRTCSVQYTDQHLKSPYRKYITAINGSEKTSEEGVSGNMWYI